MRYTASTNTSVDSQRRQRLVALLTLLLLLFSLLLPASTINAKAYVVTTTEASMQVGVTDPSTLTTVGNVLYFSAYDGKDRELWKYNGVTFTKIDINPLGDSNPTSGVAVGGTLYFSAYDGTDRELWKYDGTTLVKIDINPHGDSNPTSGVAVGNTLYFKATDQLWKYDGATLTRIYSRTVGEMAVAGSTLYFEADEELWLYDGDRALNIVVNPSGPSRPRRLTTFGNVLFFWAYKGTGVGGTLNVWQYFTGGSLKSIYSIRLADYPPHEEVSDQPIAIFRDGLYFYSPTGGFWRYDILLQKLANVSHQVSFKLVSQYFATDTVLYVIANNSTLWGYDGVTSTLIGDVGRLRKITAVGNMFYFVRIADNELWRFDGTALTKIAINQQGSSAPDHLTAFRNALYFSANDGTGRYLWRYDGTMLTKIDLPLVAAMNDRYDVTKDKALYVAPPGVLANDINANGNPRVYNLAQDDKGIHITEQAWYDYGWHDRDITAEAIPAAAPAPELGALASLSVNGAPRVYYKSRWIDTTRVIELAWHDDDKVWKWRDLTTEAISSVPPQAMDLASPVVATTVNSNPRVYYLGTDGHVYELAWVVDHWYRRDVTSDTNAPAAVPGALVATTITHDDPRVYYLDVQGHVHELAWRTLSQVWYHRDLMANAERTPAAGRALAATTANLEPRVYYLGADQHVYEFAWFSYEWHWRDVTADMRNEGINVPNAIADSPLRVTTVGSRGDPRVYFLSEGQKGRHLQELAWFNDQWNYTDLTGKIPNAQGVDQSPFAVVMVKLDPLVYYFGTDQHLHELAWRSDQWVDTAIGALPPSLLGPLSATTAQEAPLSARLVSNVAHGNLALYEDGSFVYVPNQGFPAGYVDHDSFTYVATTGSTESVATTVELDVTDECFPVDNNSLINFCFADGREPWKFWDNGSEGAYDISTDNPFAGATSAMATVRASGGNIQFYQAGLALQPKTSYELSFAAYAEDGRDMDLYVHRHGPSAPYTSYGLCARHVNLEPYWKHFTLTFTTPDLPKMDDARLRFWLAPYATAGTVYHIDRVVLRPSGEPPLAPDLCPWEAPIVPPPDHCDPMPPDTVIQNPGFEGTQVPWRFYTNGAGLFTLDTNHYECSQAAKITVSGAGGNVQLYQAGIALQPNTTYRLRLAARSNSGHDIALFVHQHGAPYTNYGIEGVPLDLTPAWKVFTIQFTTRNFTTPVTDARLRLWLAPYATAGDEYWFDDIVMQPLAVAASAVQPATMTGNAEVTSELLVEGSFIDDDNRGLLAGAEVPDISLMEQQNYIFLPLISED